jgi:hypothetical protein
VLGALAGATQGKKNNRLGQLLAGADAEPDANGFTLKDQIKSMLDVFDDRYAQAADGGPDAERDNTAMRVAAMANAMALRLVKQKDINDPLLKPVVARSIVQEYGAELARSLAARSAGSGDAKARAAEETKAKQALALAEALVAEDPVTKVFTGKITGPAAVESIRRQAEAAGIAPSRMLALQRQQLEMKVGSMTMQAVTQGGQANDQAIEFNEKGEMVDAAGKPTQDPAKAKRSAQGFILYDLYGELSPADMQRLVVYGTEKSSALSGERATLPAFDAPADGGGLVYKPTAKQVHTVKAGDTVKSIATAACGPGSAPKVIDAKVAEIATLNRYVFWTEKVAQADANQDAEGALRGKVPMGERRAQEKIDKFLPDKPLPAGAVLTLSGQAGVLDQLADYVAAWDEAPADPVAQPSAQQPQQEADGAKASLNLRRGIAEMKEREATGKVAPKVTPDALDAVARRLLPPLRPEVLDRVKGLAAEVAKLSAADRKTSPLPAELAALKAKLEDFRKLADVLAKRMKTGTRAQVEASGEFKAYEVLRRELADAAFRQAPGLGQAHGPGGTLGDARTDGREAGLQQAAQTQQRIAQLTAALKAMKQEVDKTKTSEYRELAGLVAQQEKARDTERTAGREGAMNERQYAHLRMLDRWDQEEKERFLAEKGETVEAYVTRMLAKLLKIDANAAKQALDKAFRNVERVPLTITFRAESLFSDVAKDEPAHGTAYVSEVVYSRKDVDMKDLIGRGDEADGKVAVTGGMKTQKGKDGKEGDAAWVSGRGKNYMRWRTDKDDREARQDRLPFKDQQIFGAANPNWDKTKGAVYKDTEKPDGKVDPAKGVAVGANYYGNAHFLLKDAVRKRVAYVVRGMGISEGGGKTSFQRKDFMMLFHDMIMGGGANIRYLLALLTVDSNDYVNTANAWEFHLYGGFDIRTDAQEIHLADVVDPEARKRIERFAATHGIKVAGGLQGVAVVHSGSVAPVAV